MLNIKNQFPFFKENPSLIYLDSTTTTQKPQCVINSLVEFYSKNNSSIGRSSYPLADRLAKNIDLVRKQVQKFINAKSEEEIIFTSGATDAFNKTIYALAINYLKDGDEILYCPNDHISFVSPWFRAQKLLRMTGRNVELIPFKVNEMGSINKGDLFSKITSQTKVVNITHVHNVYGSDNNIDLISDYIRSQGKDIIINLDAAQSIGHIKVDIKELGVDILSFSGHKMFTSQGIGATYLNKKLHNIMAPFFRSGLEREKKTELGGSFLKEYESGTQNYGGIISLGEAIKFIDNVGIKNIHIHLSELTQYLLEGLKKMNDIEFAYGPYYWNCKDGLGILSFKLKKISPAEVGFILSENNILVRTGNHCMGKSDKFNETIRVSMHIYNTIDDINALIRVIKKITN